MLPQLTIETENNLFYDIETETCVMYNMFNDTFVEDDELNDLEDEPIMNKSTIKAVKVNKRITRKTKLLRVESEDGEVLEFPFDPQGEELPTLFTHDDVIAYFKNEGFTVIDWTNENYFE